MSAFDPIEKTASIIFKKVGISTEILAGKKCGDSIDIIGPLGNSFTNPPRTSKSILIAGGTGMGPILFLKNFLKRRNVPVCMVIGFPSKSGIPDLKELEDETTVLCTEDGSRGFRGTVIDYLLSLPDSFFNETTLYSCGPSAMLKACDDLADKHAIESLVSLEQTMACGVGACMGCVVKIKGDQPYARVCKDGPIFNGKSIAWT